MYVIKENKSKPLSAFAFNFNLRPYIKVCLFFVLIPMGGFIVAAYMNGEVVSNPDARAAPSNGGGTCVSTRGGDGDDGDAGVRSGDAAPCCVWQGLMDSARHVIKRICNPHLLS